MNAVRGSSAGLIAAFAAALALAVLAASSARAEPNWTGVYIKGRDPSRPSVSLDAPNLKDSQLPVLTPPYRAIYEANRASLMSGSLAKDKTATCGHPGVPLNMSIAYGGEILMTPGQVTIITEWAGDVRRIFTDGRGHPDDFLPSNQGHSIGHWEGDDLVVDTVGISPKASLNTLGTQQSERMHVTERFHEYKPGFLDIFYHIEDPEAFAQPYEFHILWQRSPYKGDYIHEYECDNNRDAPRIAAKP
jgi:hypothetical protein